MVASSPVPAAHGNIVATQQLPNLWLPRPFHPHNCFWAVHSNESQPIFHDGFKV